MEVKLVTNVLKANDLLAKELRSTFSAHRLLVVNLMSAPGSGKTSLLEKSLDLLKTEVRVGVIEGDLYTSRDADRIEKKGVPVVQINTQGGCHLDAAMVIRAAASLDLAGLELLFIENVGNLVCPSSYDLGEDFRVTVISTTEGNDKPEKYPTMFRQSRALVINKIDLLPFTDFNLDEACRDARALNPEVEIFPLSARTGEGLDPWCRWVRYQLEAKRAQG